MNQRRSNNDARECGFSLVEVLIVFVVIGAVVALVMPFLKVNSDADEAKSAKKAALIAWDAEQECLRNLGRKDKVEKCGDPTAIAKARPEIKDRLSGMLTMQAGGMMTATSEHLKFAVAMTKTNPTVWFIIGTSDDPSDQQAQMVSSIFPLKAGKIFKVCLTPTLLSASSMRTEQNMALKKQGKPPLPVMKDPLSLPDITPAERKMLAKLCPKLTWK